MGATAEDLLNFVKKYDFTSCAKKYQKFKKLPISLEELKTHIAGAKLKFNAKLSKFKKGETVYFTDKPSRYLDRRRYGQTRTRKADVSAIIKGTMDRNRHGHLETSWSIRGSGPMTRTSILHFSAEHHGGEMATSPDEVKWSGQNINVTRN